MMLKYRAIGLTITQFELIRETKKMMIFLLGDSKEWRLHKDIYKDCFHDTWEDAHAALVKEEEQKVSELRKQLEHANGGLWQLKGMKKP